MARDFTPQDNMDCGDFTGLNNATVGTWLYWINFDVNATDKKIYYKLFGSSVEVHCFQGGTPSGADDELMMDVLDADVDRWLTHSTDANNVIDTWINVVCVWNGANSGSINKNGTALTLSDDVATMDGDLSDSNANLGIMNGIDGNTTSGVDGRIAHIAFYKTNFTAAEVTAISHGVNPFVFRNDIIEFYMPDNGNDDPEGQYVGQINKGTTNGSPPKFAGNPPVELLENYL